MNSRINGRLTLSVALDEAAEIAADMGVSADVVLLAAVRAFASGEPVVDSAINVEDVIAQTDYVKSQQAPRRLALVTMSPDVPEVRDPNAPCDAFATAAATPVLQRHADCEGDGHYRCKECVRLIRP